MNMHPPSSKSCRGRLKDLPWRQTFMESYRLVLLRSVSHHRGGPCGLRTAIELALLGCKVVLIEKRDTFSRNNVLHLWPFTIHDLRGLGAKKFYGKFCAGSIDHISEALITLSLLVFYCFFIIVIIY